MFSVLIRKFDGFPFKAAQAPTGILAIAEPGKKPVAVWEQDERGRRAMRWRASHD